ncbi:MAG: TraB/GumN family protein [Crocinitomicaceae bacterium]|nr:TraB/GumN family protein [Crocinitomicaceae bacterium]
MSVKKHLFFLFTFLLSVVSCSADQEIENGNSLLWKIEGNDCKTSYVFGTMHMIEPAYFKMSESLTEKIKTSEAIIMEVGGMPDPIAAMKMMSLDTGLVHDFFTKDQLQVLLEFMDKKMNTDPETFHTVYGKMKPFFILQAISQGFFSADAVSYDLNIMGIAKQNNIPLIGLETIEEQLGFFDAIPANEMADLIMSSIENFDEEKKETQKLMKIYSEENVEKLIPIMKKQSPEFMKYEDIFLTDRNKNWIPKLKSEFSEKKCFVAVGAAHLFGDNGILQLLINEGYTVTAVSTQ